VIESPIYPDTRVRTWPHLRVQALSSKPGVVRPPQILSLGGHGQKNHPRYPGGTVLQGRSRFAALVVYRPPRVISQASAHPESRHSPLPWWEGWGYHNLPSSFYFFTLTPTLSHQGRGGQGLSGWTQANPVGVCLIASVTSFKLIDISPFMLKYRSMNSQRQMALRYLRAIGLIALCIYGA